MNTIRVTVSISIDAGTDICPQEVLRQLQGMVQNVSNTIIFDNKGVINTQDGIVKIDSTRVDGSFRILTQTNT